MIRQSAKRMNACKHRLERASFVRTESPVIPGMNACKCRLERVSDSRNHLQCQDGILSNYCLMARVLVISLYQIISKRYCCYLRV